MFNFTKDCLIGIEELDNDHRRLFELINEALYLVNNEYIDDKYDRIKNILEELDDYAAQHFAREEAYMTKIRDPELIMQRVQHEHFHQQVWDLIYKKMDTDEEQQIVLDKILSFLTRWLYQHIISSDALIGKLEPLEEWMVRENPCEFLDEYKIGNELIDAEHKTLFDITGKVYSILKRGATSEDADEIIGILKELRDYTAEHFSDEEEYMRSINYPGLPQQERAHKSFIGALDDIDEDRVHEDPAEYVKSLIEFLLGWLINHILKVDGLITKS